jgi:phage/plasmid-like protein (TIGR03299 family)
MTAAEALEHGGLTGWNVRGVPLWADLRNEPGDARGLQVPRQQAIIRNASGGNVQHLGITGTGYAVIQNEQHVKFLDLLAGESGANFQTAGYMKDGQIAFVSMKLPESARIGGQDLTDFYLTAVNYHDGNGSFTVMVTPIRVNCSNVMNLALKQSVRSIKIRHTQGSVAGMLGDARRALDITHTYTEQFTNAMNFLVGEEVTNAQFDALVAGLFASAEGAGEATVTRNENKATVVKGIYYSSPTQADIRGTKWGALNALTEWSDHFAPVRGEDAETRRAFNAIMAPAFKDRALAAVLAL